MTDLSQIDWEDILDTLKDQRCVLFLGAGAYLGPNGQHIEKELAEWLEVDQKDHPLIRLYNPDGFFLLKKNRYKRKLIARIKDFYNEIFAETESQFLQLAQIPFPIIVSLTPDNILARTFDKHGFEYWSDFYFRHRKASSFEQPTAKRPLIYNLLGNIEEPESLVLTHSDFFDYLDSVFKANSMNEELRYKLETADRYIFLGLPYERWYFQLLLRVLSMHSDKLKEVERLALKEFEDPHLRELYTEEFKIDFIPTNISTFVDQLYQHCKTADLLKAVPVREVEEAPPGVKTADIRDLIAQAKTEQAMRYLQPILERSGHITVKDRNRLVILQNRFNLLRQREQRGSIYPQDLVVENNQIIEALLDLVTKVEEV